MRPSNATLPLSESEFMASIAYEAYSMTSIAYKAYSMIVFSVPDGTYGYKVEPIFLAQMGTLTVNDADVLVKVYSPPVSCVTESTTL